jgi:predicted 2-oxoglutarate/Fe(II)-dependent dioxygenase YbiX/peroxiredoxin
LANTLSNVFLLSRTDMTTYLGGRFPLIGGRTNVETSAALGNIAGRYALFCAFGNLGPQVAQDAVELVRRHAKLSNGVDKIICLISSSSHDEHAPALRDLPTNVIVLWDHDREAVRALGLLNDSPDGLTSMTPVWILVDPMFRIERVWPLREAKQALAGLADTLSPDDFAGTQLTAPVLLVPRIFEPELCKLLINTYEKHGGTPSGVARMVDGLTQNVDIPKLKKRSDVFIEDHQIRANVLERLQRRLIPEIERVFRYEVTHVERHLIACYDAQTGGYFKPHRDDTTPGTKHRAFAVTINLNSDEYDGGELRFPEFGNRCYKPPSGGAVVFSCALLHEATPVRRGKRYAYLPFLYNEAGEAYRQENKHLLGSTVLK